MFPKYSCTIVPGELVHIEVLGRHIVFVNSIRVANDLFEKRSANYSDRNALPMINDLMGWDWSFGHMPYGMCEHTIVAFRLIYGLREVTDGERIGKCSIPNFNRRLCPSFGPFNSRKPMPSFADSWTNQTHLLITFACRCSSQFVVHVDGDDHVVSNAASSIMKVVYGIDVAPKDDYYIAIAERALDGMAKAASPGAFLVDILPIRQSNSAFGGLRFLKLED